MSKSSPAARGLGAEYRARRRCLAPAAGEPCPFCGVAMWAGQKLDADHLTPRVLGGSDGPLRWAHASCNRSAGAALGNRLRAGFGKVRSRRW